MVLAIIQIDSVVALPPCPVSWLSSNALAVVPHESSPTTPTGWVPMPDLGALDSDEEVCASGISFASRGSTMLTMFGTCSCSSVVPVGPTYDSCGPAGLSGLDDPEVSAVLDSSPLEHSFQGISRLAKGRPRAKATKGLEKTKKTAPRKGGEKASPLFQLKHKF